MNYTENQLKALAKNNPKELVKILTSSSTNVNVLTFGLEILGEEVKDPCLVIPVFKQLLKHINAIVREGTIIGMSAFFTDSKPPQDILDRLKLMSSNDQSPVLK